MADEKEEPAAETQTKDGHPHALASPQQVTALSPSPFPSAGDQLKWERVTDDGEVLQLVDSEGSGDTLTPLHRVYSQTLCTQTAGAGTVGATAVDRSGVATVCKRSCLSGMLCSAVCSGATVTVVGRTSTGLTFIDSGDEEVDFILGQGQ